MFVYFTVNCEKQGSDLDKYPQAFKDNIYIVSYGLDGITDHLDSNVYDYHRSFETSDNWQSVSQFFKTN